MSIQGLHSDSSIQNMSYIDLTYKWMVHHKFTEFHNVDLESENSLLFGKPQGSKSAFTFGVALMCLLKQKSVIFIVRNYTQDVEHMKAKLDRFAKEHMKAMKEYGFTNTPSIGVVDAAKMSLEKKSDGKFIVKDYHDVKEALHGRNMKMVIALANGIQLKAINMILDQIDKEKESEKCKLVVLTDEADAVGYSKLKIPEPEKHKTIEYGILRSRCTQSFEISATVWDILAGNEGLTNKNIVYIRPPPSYKGIRDGVQFIELAYPIERYNPMRTCLFEEDPNLIQVYEELMETPIYKKERYNCSIDHPVIVMHKTKWFIHHHQQFFDLFKTNAMYFKVWTVLMECDKGLYLYSDVLRGKTIKIDSVVVSDPSLTGEFMFGKRIIIPQLLQWFIDNGGAELFSHIVIKSGGFSGRSRSYVSTDGTWHLTHQYYGGNTTIPAMIQAQRILHDRPDSIPLIEYAPRDTIHSLLKGDMIQDEQIERLLKIKDLQLYTHVQLGEEKWTADKVPKAKLCCANNINTFRIESEQKIKGEDGGWDIEYYTDVLDDISRLDNVDRDTDDENETESENEGDEDYKYTVIESDKFKRGTNVHEMIKHIELCIINEGMINQKIPIDLINKKIQENEYWSDRSLDNIRGIIWTTVRKSKNLLRTNKELSNTLLYWNEGSIPYVKLNYTSK